MRFEPFGVRQSHGGWAKRGEAFGIEFQDRGAFHEIENRQTRGESGAPRRGEHVVGACNIIANHLRRVAPDEDRAGIVNPRGKFFRVRRRNLKMLWRETVGKGGRLIENS